MSYEHIRSAGDTDLHGEVLVSGEPALGGFDLEFTNSDHHVGSVVVGGATYDGTGINYRDYLLGLSDQDGEDPARLSSKYFPLGPVPTFTVTGSSDGGGRAEVPIPRLEDDELFVLRGFEIRAATGSNHHVRGIGVRHVRSASVVAVDFSDDSPDDDEYTFWVHYFVLPHAARTGYRTNPHFVGSFEQDFSFAGSAAITKVQSGGVALLSGFSFRFQSGDQHLRRIAVDLEPADSFEVTFTDDERSHTVDGFVSYVIAAAYVR